MGTKNQDHAERLRTSKLIKAARLKRDLTMEELAKSIGMTRQLLYKYENGVQEPSTKQLDRIADGLGCSRCDICPHHYRFKDNKKYEDR